MKITNFIRTVCIVLIGFAIGFISYKKISANKKNKPNVETNAILVKKFLLKYKNPEHIEIQNFVKNKNTRFLNDIQDIKNLKLFLDKNSNYYIELQIFTDENDSKAPLIVQCRFLELKSKNLIKEESLNLF